jgi:hypothetical protein
MIIIVNDTIKYIHIIFHESNNDIIKYFVLIFNFVSVNHKTQH